MTARAPNTAGATRRVIETSDSLGAPRPTTSAAVATSWSYSVPNCPTLVPYGKFVQGSNGIVVGQCLTV